MQEDQNHMPDTEDIFKHLNDPTFELDNLLNEFNAQEIKVNITIQLFSYHV